MKILILGAGKMGSFFTDLLSFEHEVAVLESDPKRMRFIYNALRLQKPEEVAEFKPELVINCVTLSYTIEAFKSVMPYLQPYCIISLSPKGIIWEKYSSKISIPACAYISANILSKNMTKSWLIRSVFRLHPQWYSLPR